jgi:uncharacterized membrane protein
MATQPTSDAPFGLQPNVAAGLAYAIFLVVGGLIMLFGGGTNKFVKFAAAQAIVLWGVMFVLNLVLFGFLHLWLLYPIVALLEFVLWLYLVITAFMGKEVQLPMLSDWTKSMFASQLA